MLNKIILCLSILAIVPTLGLDGVIAVISGIAQIILLVAMIVVLLGLLSHLAGGVRA